MHINDQSVATLWIPFKNDQSHVFVKFWSSFKYQCYHISSNCQILTTGKPLEE